MGLEKLNMLSDVKVASYLISRNLFCSECPLKELCEDDISGVGCYSRVKEAIDGKHGDDMVDKLVSIVLENADSIDRFV